MRLKLRSESFEGDEGAEIGDVGLGVKVRAQKRGLLEPQWMSVNWVDEEFLVLGEPKGDSVVAWTATDSDCNVVPNISYSCLDCY